MYQEFARRRVPQRRISILLDPGIGAVDHASVVEAARGLGSFAHGDDLLLARRVGEHEAPRARYLIEQLSMVIRCRGIAKRRQISQFRCILERAVIIVSYLLLLPKVCASTKHDLICIITVIVVVFATVIKFGLAHDQIWQFQILLELEQSVYFGLYPQVTGVGSEELLVSFAGCVGR